MSRILIVDDEPEIRMLTNIMLKREGHEIDEAESGEACLEKLKKETYDLILLDVMMPGGIDGWKVCEKIKADEKTKDTPVLLFTVRTERQDVENGKTAGADGQIDKPFGKEELVEAVDKILKGN